MKQALELRVGQKLTMTPQLQQAIKMLQLSALELQQEIQQALDHNFMLEEGVEEEIEWEATSSEPELAASERLANEEWSSSSEFSSTEIDSEPLDRFENPLGEIEPLTTTPDELATDSSWEDTFEPLLPASSGDHDEEDRHDFADSRPQSLQDHLLWQMELSRFTALDRAIAEAIIDAVNEEGFLTQSVDELHAALQPAYPELELAEVVAVLHRVQQFDPAGVAAESLQESLLLQLRQQPNSPIRQLALKTVKYYFDKLASRDYAQMKRRLKISDSEFNEVMSLIRQMNPRPGSAFQSAGSEFVTPDVLVFKVKGEWRAVVNPEHAPRLRVNSHYLGLMRQMGERDGATLRTHLQEARWFIKSLQSRNETLLKVSEQIILHQRDFLEQGAVGMRPMILADIARELDMHESTISRTTNRKYMHTPRGLFELKYFFSSHVQTAEGGECSSTAIRAMIKEIIAQESPIKPLSDDKVALLLKERGIHVARRTIAKYREAMGIAPSNERKRLT